MASDISDAAAPGGGGSGGSAAAAIGAPYLLQLLCEVAGSKNSASAVSDVCKVWWCMSGNPFCL